MFGRGKGHSEYVGFAKENALKAHVTKVCATTRFASSSFSQFESIYESNEALCKAFSKMRETDDEEDVLSKPMEMMIKSQLLDQYLWSVTKWWPRVEAILSTMKRDLDKQISVPEIVTLKKELFPKLSAHYEDLNEEQAKNCVLEV